MQTCSLPQTPFRIITNCIFFFLGADEDRQRIFDAWKKDIKRLEKIAETGTPSAHKTKVWQVYGKVKYFVKQLKFPQTSVLRFHGPVADILGIAIGITGLRESIQKKNTLGIVNNVLAIVGGATGLLFFGLKMATGLEIFGTVGGLLGAAFFVVPIMISLIWPKSPTVDTANRLTEISSDNLNAYRTQLRSFTASGTHR